MDDFNQSIIVTLALVEHQNKGDINQLKVRGKNQKNGRFEIGLPY